jgi:hypothetical protein
VTAAAGERRVLLLRIGLLTLAAPQVVIGTWALFAPRAFYDGFPATGHAWVALLPPYNEHLVRDVGALNLAVSAVLVAAALAPHRSLATAALVAQLVYTVPHAVFHVTHLEGFPVTDAVVQTAGFAVQVVLPLVLLVLVRSLSAAPPPSPGRRTAVRPPSRSPSSPSA